MPFSGPDSRVCAPGAIYLARQIGKFGGIEGVRARQHRPELIQHRTASLCGIAGNDRAIDRSDRRAGNPVGVEPMFVQRLIDANLVCTERTPSLQHKSNPAIRGPLWHGVAPRYCCWAILTDDSNSFRHRCETERDLRRWRGGLRSCRDKLERDAVVTETLAGRWRAVVENMPLMAAAARAMILRARIDKLEIRLGGQP